jgi:hypothetical protein
MRSADQRQLTLTAISALFGLADAPHQAQVGSLSSVRRSHQPAVQSLSRDRCLQLAQFLCTYSRNAKLTFRVFAVEMISALIPTVLDSVNRSPTPPSAAASSGGDEFIPPTNKRRIDSVTMVTPRHTPIGAALALAPTACSCEVCDSAKVLRAWVRWRP